MRRIAVFLQLLFYSFIFIPCSHSIAPMSVCEVDNVLSGSISLYTVCYGMGLAGLFTVIFYLNHEKAFLINMLSSLLLLLPMFQYINWHTFWIPCLTAIPFVLISISSFLQLRIN